VALAIAIIAAEGGQGAASQVEFAVDGLQGTLERPDTGPTESVPTALIIAGSGPTDRDGNSVAGLRTDAYKMLSAALAGMGIACARYDKRGIAASRGAGRPENEVRISQFADDAVDIAHWLRAQSGVGSIALIGHSEGGVIALLSAARVKPAAIVLLSSPGRKFATILREQSAAPGLPPDFTREAHQTIAALERGEDVAEVSPMLASIFRPSVQPFIRSLMALDPAGLLRSYRGSVLIVGGGRDLQIGRSDFDLLTGARPDAAGYWDPSMGHTLKSARTAQEAYTDPRSPLATGLAERIAEFIRSGGQRARN
jgi:pimeloyl-ACP methyl ester carboxylesterase